MRIASSIGDLSLFTGIPEVERTTVAQAVSLGSTLLSKTVAILALLIVTLHVVMPMSLQFAFTVVQWKFASPT